MLIFEVISTSCFSATLRAAVTALAQEASNDAKQQRGRETKNTEDAVEALWRSPARYLWAMLLARIYESAPLACPCYITDYVWGSSTPNYPSDYVSTTPTSRTVM